MSYEELDKWAADNAPNLNRAVLKSMVTVIADSDNISTEVLNLDVSDLTTENSNYDAETGTIILEAGTSKAYSKVVITVSSSDAPEA